jgi:hypothetical protein
VGADDKRGISNSAVMGKKFLVLGTDERPLTNE